MGIESRFGRTESQEHRENEPSDMYVYASEHEVTETSRDYFTKQGFGISEPLDAPATRRGTSYSWQGRIHPYKEEVGLSHFDNGKLEVVASSFSSTYMGHQNPELKKQGLSSYRLLFDPSEEVINDFEKTNKWGTQHGEKHSIRPLTEQEQEEFLKAFRAANQEYVRREKEVKKRALKLGKTPLPPPPLPQTKKGSK